MRPFVKPRSQRKTSHRDSVLRSSLWIKQLRPCGFVAPLTFLLILLLTSATAVAEHKSQRGTKTGPQGTLPIERSEDSTFVAAGILFQNGVIEIRGSDLDADSAFVTLANDSTVRVTLRSDQHAPVSRDFARGDVDQIVFRGRAGDDVFINATDIPSTAYGGDGQDTLVGGSAGDKLSGGRGNDWIRGNEGGDDIRGGRGADTLRGDGGNDVIRGGNGRDTIFGGRQGDTLYGGRGEDRLSGEGGKDLIVSIGGDTDTITGGPQRDNIWLDATDVLNDDSAAENALGYVHRVNQFAFGVSNELNGPDLQDPEPRDKRLNKKNFSDNPLFASHGPSRDDVFQGHVGDCYFMSRLSAIADANPRYIKNMVVDLGDGTYAVRLFRKATPSFVRVDGDLWMNGENQPEYAKLGREGSIWVPIVEKAYAFFRKKKGTYSSIVGGNRTLDEHLNLTETARTIDDDETDELVIEWFRKHDVNTLYKIAADAADSLVKPPEVMMLNQMRTNVVDLLNWINGEIAIGKAVVTGAPTRFSNDTAITLDNFRRGQHVYHVVEVLTDAEGTPTGMVLRNPFGRGPSNGYITITDFTRIYFCVKRTVSSAM